MSSGPHDAYFKWVFSDLDNARGEFASVLPPEIAARVDWSSLRLEAGSLVDGRLRETLTDLQFSVRLARREVRLQLLWEHQSRQHRWMPLRSLGYAVGTWELWARAHASADRLPPLIPILLSQVDGGWTAATDLLSIVDFADDAERAAFAPFHPQCRIIVDDLAQLTHDALDARKVPAAAKLALAALREVRGAKDPAALVEGWARWIVAVRRARRGKAALRSLARYIGEVRASVDLEQVTAAVEQIDHAAGEVFMTAAEELRREGEAKGKAEMLLKLLPLFFGRVSAAMAARIRRADAPTLDRWAERVRTARSIRDVVAD